MAAEKKKRFMKTGFLFAKSLRMFLLCSERVGQSVGLFPLTPPLSLGEREKLFPSLASPQRSDVAQTRVTTHPAREPRSAAVPAASSSGVSPLGRTRGGTPRELAG